MTKYQLQIQKIRQWHMANERQQIIHPVKYICYRAHKSLPQKVQHIFTVHLHSPLFLQRHMELPRLSQVKHSLSHL